MPVDSSLSVLSTFYLVLPHQPPLGLCGHDDVLLPPCRVLAGVSDGRDEVGEAVAVGVLLDVEAIHIVGNGLAVYPLALETCGDARHLVVA